MVPLKLNFSVISMLSSYDTKQEHLCTELFTLQFNKGQLSQASFCEVLLLK